MGMARFWCLALARAGLKSPPGPLPAGGFRKCRVPPVAFLAIAEAQQLYHWLPVALHIAKDRGVPVSVLSPSPALLDLVQSYDPDGRLDLIRLHRPSWHADSLFRLPSRLATLLLNYHTIARFPLLVTTEISSGWLRHVPGFSSRMALIKHGAGDRAGGYKARHSAFDLTLVAGEKDRQRMIELGLCTPENCVVGGYAKFELMAPPQRFFDKDDPVILYNPHFDPKLSSWLTHGPEILRALEALTGYNVIIAPHTKMARNSSPIRSSAPHIRIDMGSRHSIDMSYTNSADIYLGDVSSQVYEYLLRPRPCAFFNLDHIDYRDDPNFSHWKLGQVIEDIGDLPAVLDRAASAQAGFAKIQREAVKWSIDEGPEPASHRQADAILAFARKSGLA